MSSLVSFFILLIFSVSASAGDIGFDELIQQGNRQQREVAAEVQQASGVETKPSSRTPQASVSPDDSKNSKDFAVKLKKKSKKKKKKTPPSEAPAPK